ncbi:hypothetical protein [Crateriforma conspicua]|uniref:hypothetical protein n=1 Tax=Crateriforma conspicua TaxID=2527996 RepID=UPI00118C8F35|nr:hypothetical protein [Crateriforma conspicua]QDV60935.1 hypothetical protein Mal65_00560 [Crateriforma conspicua]
MTSTMPLCESLNENHVKAGTKQDATDRLHQWLHQIAESDERTVAAVLVDAVAELFGRDGTERLLAELEHQAEAERVGGPKS